MRLIAPILICLTLLLGLALTSAAQAVTPLSKKDRQRLDDANDRTGVLDEPALYPLLENVISWTDEKKPVGVALNYEAVMDSPHEFRGTLFEIVGEYPRAIKVRSRKDFEVIPDKVFDITKFNLPGPWENAKVQQWTIVVQEGENALDHKLAVIYVIDPPPIRSGEQVKIVARFYKLWRTEGMNGKQYDYPFFVGKSVTTVSGLIGSSNRSTGGSKRQGGGGVGRVMQVLLGLVVVLVGAYFFLRKRLGAAKASTVMATRQRRIDRLESGYDDEDEEDDHTPLPKEPGEALAEMQRRHETGDMDPSESGLSIESGLSSESEIDESAESGEAESAQSA